EPPHGRGLRVDTFGRTGYRTTGSFDSLLAKVITTTRGDFATACRANTRALQDFAIQGVETNRDFLSALLEHPDLAAGRIDTAWVERHATSLVARAAEIASLRPAAQSAAEQTAP